MLMTIIRVIKKFNVILTERQKKRIILLGMMMIIGGLLETCSVSMMYPFISCILNPDELMTNNLIAGICNVFNITSPKTLLLIMAILMAVLYISKNIYLVLQYNVQYRFVFNNMFSIQSKLLESYLRRPYEYFFNINSAEIIRIITSDTFYAFSTLVTLLQLFAELVVAIMLVMAVFVITPLVSFIMICVFAVMLYAINLYIKPILRKAGRNQQDAGTGMNKWLLQSLQGIKDVKVTEAEEYFKSNFDKYGYKYAQALRINNILQYIPRCIIEGISFGIVFVTIALLIIKGVNLETIIPTLSAVAMASVRLLPSINRISSAFAKVEYNEVMVDKMVENMGILYEDDNNQKSQYGDKKDKETLSMRKEISLNDIYYKYPNTDNDVIHGVNICLKKGQSIGIVGSSGSGKSTIVDIILGLLIPYSGAVEVDGKDINNNLSSWHSHIGYIPQAISMLDDTIRLNIAFGIPEKDISEDRIWEVLREASLDDFVRNLPDGIETNIGERGVRLSGGQRQRIGIARALYRNPSILIFDEATSALDMNTEAEIMNSIYGLSKDKTIIIIAHRLSTLDRCDVIYKVDNGVISKQI
jgi:ABC-type multidrug transport system fused ATPase/permease subunit